ncbi:MAG: GGDEF domain-containing protein [Deltaproteobacteria bacterium]
MGRAAQPVDKTKTRTISVVGSLRGRGREAALVVIHGGELGRRFPLAKEELVIGRGRKVDVEVDDESVSRRHAVVLREAGEPVVRDLGSTNGTLVNDRKIDEYVLRNGDLVKIGRTIFKFIAGGDIEQLYHEEIYRLTTVDGLTQVANRRYFTEQLEREMSRCRRYGRRLTVGVFDIDRFKAVNDGLGHLAGDLLLRDLAALVRERIRREDVFARLGGDEFALALPETLIPQAEQLGEKLRKLVEKTPFDLAGKRQAITISLGLAEYRGKASSAAELIERADQKLYQAKRGGRNRVCA